MLNILLNILFIYCLFLRNVPYLYVLYLYFIGALIACFIDSIYLLYQIAKNRVPHSPDILYLHIMPNYYHYTIIPVILGRILIYYRYI